MEQTTKNSRDINADAITIYQAFINPTALEVWLAPGEMTGKIHSFNLKIGGGYTMSLFYPSTEKKLRGKTSGKEDKFTAKFIELTPNKRIVQAINFDSANKDFAGEMIMEVTFVAVDKGTRVTFLFKNIPTGINPAANEEGTISTLEKLAHYVELHR
jgi:uncharacterized protein YndB with AHSA1/START domain